MSILIDRRLGHFSIELGMINDQPVMVRQLMASIIVIRAEARLDVDQIEYFAQSDLFEPSPRFEIAPQYRPIFHTPDGFAGFERVEPLR